MQIGVVGLGRMGGNIARRLMRAGHEVAVFDVDPKAVAALAAEGARGTGALEELTAALRPPRIFWVMLPAGRITEETVMRLGALAAAGDVIIDGGNTHFRDDIRRAAALAPRGIHYLDVGTSGGVWGLERGYCLMIGGEAEVVERLDPLFRALAPGLGTIPRTPRPEGADPRPELGYLHAGPAGAGHFVKMVHNGIEYGLMQAYAEGFDLLRHRESEHLPEAERYRFNLADIAEVWRRGSVISSWLLDLAAEALARSADLAEFSGVVADSGEGRWTVEAAIAEAVPLHVISAALFERFRSRDELRFADKFLSALRFGFGGHVEPAEKKRGLPHD